MNKRITAILLVFLLVASLAVLVMPVKAAPSSVSLTITADKTEANSGDTIYFTVTLGPVSEMGGIGFRLSIPDGLTFVSGSGTLSVTKASLGFDDLDFNESNSLCFSGTASDNDFASTSDTELMTFQCTVNDDASGTLTVGFDTINNSDFFSCQTWEQWGDKVDTGSAGVTIAEEIESPTDPPTDPPTEAPAAAPVKARKKASAKAPAAEPTGAPATTPKKASKKVSAKSAATEATEATEPVIAGNLPKKPSPTEKSKATEASDLGQWWKNGRKDGSSPKTGNNSPKSLWLLFILAAAIVAGIVVYIVKRKKTKNSDR